MGCGAITVHEHDSSGARLPPTCMLSLVLIYDPECGIPILFQGLVETLCVTNEVLSVDPKAVLGLY